MLWLTAWLCVAMFALEPPVGQLFRQTYYYASNSPPLSDPHSLPLVRPS